MMSLFSDNSHSNSHCHNNNNNNKNSCGSLLRNNGNESAATGADAAAIATAAKAAAGDDAADAAATAVAAGVDAAVVAAAAVGSNAKTGKRVVYIAGSWDMFHAGHLQVAPLVPISIDLLSLCDYFFFEHVFHWSTAGDPPCANVFISTLSLYLFMRYFYFCTSLVIYMCDPP